MLNHIVLQGRLTRDPELRRTQTGTAVASFTLAVERDYAPEGQERQVDFIDCVAWRGTGEFVSRYFKKGHMAIVTGRVQSRRWTDDDGRNRTSFEVNCTNVYFGQPKRTEAEREAYAREPYAPVELSGFEELEDDDGELPF